MVRKHYTYLDDKDFLKRFDNSNNKEQFVKIIVLTWFDEVPIEEIQGKIVSGSNSLNGSSNVRRTCNLQMIIDDAAYNIKDIKNLISINKKISIEIGFTNNTDEYIDYDILWFPQGTFLIKQPNISLSSNGLNLSLQLEDKMSLLNGAHGGVIPAATTFDSFDSYDEEGNLTIIRTPIYQIIRTLVHEFGGEDYSRIILL